MTITVITSINHHSMNFWRPVYVNIILPFSFFKKKKKKEKKRTSGHHLHFSTWHLPLVTLTPRQNTFSILHLLLPSAAYLATAKPENHRSLATSPLPRSTTFTSLSTTNHKNSIVHHCHCPTPSSTLFLNKPFNTPTSLKPMSIILMVVVRRWGTV